jgi:hypothetical protein
MAAEVEVEVAEATGTTTTVGLARRRSAPITARKDTTKKRSVWNFKRMQANANKDGNQFSTE